MDRRVLRPQQASPTEGGRQSPVAQAVAQQLVGSSRSGSGTAAVARRHGRSAHLDLARTQTMSPFSVLGLVAEHQHARKGHAWLGEIAGVARGCAGRSPRRSRDAPPARPVSVWASTKAGERLTRPGGCGERPSRISAPRARPPRSPPARRAGKYSATTVRRAAAPRRRSVRLVQARRALQKRCAVELGVVRGRARRGRASPSSVSSSDFEMLERMSRCHDRALDLDHRPCLMRGHGEVGWVAARRDRLEPVRGRVAARSTEQLVVAEHERACRLRIAGWGQ